MALTRCSRCAREISLLVSKCPHCGAAITELGTLVSPPPPPPPHGPLYEIAYRQKLVLYAVLFDFLVLAPAPLLRTLPESPVTLSLTVLITVLCLCLVVFYCWAYYKLGVALGVPKAVIYIGEACLIFPGVSLIVLIRLARIATRKLRRAGVDASLLGANLREIPQDR